jgi:hypothetical protein
MKINLKKYGFVKTDFDEKINNHIMQKDLV